MGGSGKSVTAAAIARETEVVARFRDGILWTTLGQQPNLADILAGWIQAVSERPFQFSDVETGQRHLASLLRDQHVLLVVDDAWDGDHVVKLTTGVLAAPFSLPLARR